MAGAQICHCIYLIRTRSTCESCELIGVAIWSIRKLGDRAEAVRRADRRGVQSSTVNVLEERRS